MRLGFKTSVAFNKVRVRVWVRFRIGQVYFFKVEVRVWVRMAIRGRVEF